MNVIKNCLQINQCKKHWKPSYFQDMYTCKKPVCICLEYLDFSNHKSYRIYDNCKHIHQYEIFKENINKKDTLIR